MESSTEEEFFVWIVGSSAVDGGIWSAGGTSRERNQSVRSVQNPGLEL